MTAQRWLLLGSLVLIASVGCGDSGGGDDDGTSGSSGSAGSGPAGSGGSGTAGSGTSGSAGTGSPAGTGGTSAGSGGSAAGTAGTAPTAGTAGSGTSGAGGSTGGGGSGSGGAPGGSGGSGSMACNATDITISSSMVSDKIQTVGIVEWSTAVAGATSAKIEFGLEPTYGMTAPVATLEASNRTLLLGMKQDKTYHYRIVVTSPAGDCAGPDQTIETGFLPSGLPNIDIETMDATKLDGGFFITGQYSQVGGQGSPAYILDGDGDFVWAYLMPMRDVTGVKPSYDGKYMWLNSANVPETQGSKVLRITIDGQMVEDLSDKFVGQNHQVTILPDETVGFYSYSEGSDDCDDVKEYNPTTQEVKLIKHSADAHGASPPCHLNAIEYWPPTDDAPQGGYLFSDLQNSNITKIKRDGTVVWVIGGETNQFTGTGSSWTNQHGIDYISEDRILFYNNGMGTTSIAIEMLLHLDTMTAERAWTFDTKVNNNIMGDVQRLDNGNTIVASSTKGLVQEVSAEGDVLQEMSFPSNGQFGYIQKRKSLYGPPPR